MSKFDDQYLDLCERILRFVEKVTTDPAVLQKKRGESGVSMPTHVAQTAKPTTTSPL